MDNLKMHTPDLAAENFKKLAAMFPNAVTETVNEDGEVVRAIDADVLRQEISAAVVEGAQERYKFTWPDKKKSVVLANAPIAKTLRLDRAKSVGRDGTPGSIDTENIYIEGDNLDALKLLQETYLGKVKMIYIDPPYNTGSDAFVYDDDYSASTGEFSEASGQRDEAGNLLFDMRVNNESNGRFHTDWLNMIYPRLRIAKDLLSENGVIFVSINDIEVSNLSKCLDDIFGVQNRIGYFTWISKTGGGSDNDFVVNDQEFVLCYCKSAESVLPILNKIEIESEPLDKEDEHGKYRIGRELNKWGANSRREDRPTMYFPIPGPNGEDVYPIRNDGTEGCWRWGKPAMMEAVKAGNCEFASRGDGTYIVYEKIRTTDNRYKPYRTFLTETGTTADGTKEVRDIFDGKKVFDFPKPIRLLSQLINIAATEECYVLDFFSGSATSAHALLKNNADDSCRRKFIMIQFPEKLNEGTEGLKAGYETICDIGEERIRRAGRKIKEESPLTTNDLDIGFRVFRVDSTNMEDVYYRPADYDQRQMQLFTDNIKKDRTPEDLLIQVMLDLGVMLSSKIEETEIAGKKVFSVADGYLIACFDDQVTEETVKAIAQRHPFYAVFRDSGMATDSVATNFEQIFETYSPKTQRKVL